LFLRRRGHPFSDRRDPMIALVKSGVAVVYFDDLS
jgi:hypothetical protein